MILSVRPGITDPATLELRREEELLAAQSDPEAYYCETLLPEKASSYRRYVEGRTSALDLAIIARTLKQVVRA